MPKGWGLFQPWRSPIWIIDSSFMILMSAPIPQKAAKRCLERVGWVIGADFGTRIIDRDSTARIGLPFEFIRDYLKRIFNALQFGDRFFDNVSRRAHEY